jgi:hypothetical protein
MLNIFGKDYYINIDEIIKKCRPDYGTENFKNKQSLTSSEDGNGEPVLELNVFKFEVFKACIERILNEYEEVDENLGILAENNTSVSFKMAFNTLLKYEILTEDDNE